ncbi:MAG: hypothetical protein ACJAZX_000455 [Rickettsiales bacterium]|jgi:hypothetical protein
MLIFINLTIIFGLSFAIVKFISTSDFTQKIISFYFLFTGLVILILINSTASFELAIDIAFLLFLLELAALLFLISNHKK